jgi:hypothetical protein
VDSAKSVYYILLFCACVAVIAGWAWFRTKRASRNWRTVTGRVLEADLETSTSQEPGRDGNSYYPRIRYEYEVDGVPYVSTAWRPGDVYFKRYLSREKARGVIARYPVGKPATVYYDPASPGESALER